MPVDQEGLHDAKEALQEIKRGNAGGFKFALHGRALVEGAFELLAKLYTWKIPYVPLCLLLLVLNGYLLLWIGFVNTHLETDVEDLWIEKGGRLDSELDYSDAHVDDDFLTTLEVIIQDVNSDNFSASLYDHLRLLQALTEVEIELDGRTYKYRDICAAGRLSAPTVPELQRVADGLLPCLIYTPLDCYWEGSFLQRPDSVVPAPIYCPEIGDVTWENFNVTRLIECFLSNSSSGFTLFVEQQINGLLLNGYTSNPCFTTDPNCPTALADPVQNALVNGCRGYSDFIVEPAALIAAGGDFDQKRPNAVPEALRSTVVLNGPAQVQEDLLLYQGINVTRGQADVLLHMYKDRFYEIVYDFNERLGAVRKLTPDGFYGWTSDTFDELAAQYSAPSPILVFIGYSLMIIYCLSTFLAFNWVKSHATVGLMGLVLVAVASFAALGLTAACGLSFNIYTTQIFPFVVLGLGVDDMFVIADAFFEEKHKQGPNADIRTLIRRTMRVVGPSITLTSITNAAGFYLAAIIPIPAIRIFALQVGTAVIFNYIALLIGLPSYLVLDHLRSEKKLADFFCCMPARKCLHANVYCGEPKQSDDSGPVTEQNGTTEQQSEAKGKAATWFSLDYYKKITERYNSFLTAVVVKFYSPFLQNYIVKIVVLVLFTALFGCCVWGATTVEDGLNVEDVVPSGTPVHGFAVTNARHFAFSSLQIVTKEINYTDPDVQLSLLRMNEEVRTPRYIIEAGGFTEYWLTAMIRYFSALQAFYCNVLDFGNRNSQDYADLTSLLTLILQSLDPSQNMTLTGAKVVTCDFTLVITDNESRSYIPPQHFYQYVSLWRNLDSIFYDLTKPTFNPTPPRGSVTTWFMTGIPEYGPILYVQQTLFSQDLRDTDDYKYLIEETRDILGRYQRYEIDSYPSGTPFLFWEQYINLRTNVGLACGLILAACFVATTIFLMDIWSSIILVSMLAAMGTEVFGFIGFLDIKFSAIPAIMLIASVGVAVEFTAPLAFYFLKAVSDPGEKKIDILGVDIRSPRLLVRWFETRNERMHKALEHRFTPIFNGTATTFLGIIMLAFAPLPFIVKYFFAILLVIVILGALNGLVLLPVLLSLVGPIAQAYPKKSDKEGEQLEAKNMTYDEVAETVID